MRNEGVFFFVILAVLFCSAACYAQQLPFTLRDAMILMAVEQLEERQQFSEPAASFDSREKAISAVISQLGETPQPWDERKGPPPVSTPKVRRKKVPGIGLVDSVFKRIASRIHPYLSAQATLDDNVDLSRKKRSSLEYSTTAGVRGSYITKGANSFNLDVFMTNEYFERRAEQNTQNLTIYSQFNFGVKRNTFSITNSYSTNYIADDSFGVKTDQLARSWSDTLGLSWGKHFNRIGFDINAAHSLTSYEDDYKTNDNALDSFGIGQYLMIGRKTRLSLDYQYQRTKYERMPASDSRLDTFSLELAGVVSPKITGAFNIDYSLSDPKVGTDSKTRAFGLNFAYGISNRTNLSLNLVHTVFDDAVGAATYYTEDAFILSGQHRMAFNPRLSLNFLSEVVYTDYPKRQGTHNENTIYTVGLGLGYAFRQWLDLNLSWEHARKQSNIDTDINYNQNTVLFTSTARF
jgi:hypothetical protein